MDDLLVAVLAGGEGRRMGGVKALRPFRGQALVAHAVTQARRWSELVVVVVRDARQVQGAADAPLVIDRPDVEGPLAGLAAALEHAAAAGARRVLTLPCDMPNLPQDLPVRLGAAFAPEHRAVLPVAAGELQPICGMWRTSALQELPAYLAAGRRSLKGFATTCGLATVDFGDGAQAFANANSPEELERLERER